MMGHKPHTALGAAGEGWWVEALQHHARHQADRVALIVLQDGVQESDRLSYAQLDLQLRSMAAHLQGLGLQGQRLLVAQPSGLAFVTVFLACLYAGVIPVCVPDPSKGRWSEQVLAIAADCQASAIAAPADWPALALPRVDTVPSSVALAAQWLAPAVTGETLAYVQYTSGSTSAPKGVMVTFGNLLANQRMIAEAQQLGPDEVSLNWLPTYHDMGLVGGLLQPLWIGATLVMMPPLHMLARPARWLQAIHRYRVTATGGPNFAYQNCVDRIRDEQMAGLDLSCWRLAFVGAEPVKMATLQAFSDKFASAGFKAQAFYPCYGMAELVLFASGPVAGEGAQERSLTVDGKPRVATSCGRVWGASRLLIVDPISACPVAPGQSGEIWIAGEHVASGYWGQADLSRERFQARVQGGDSTPFLRTRDAGMVLDGALYVLGRLDDVVVVRGVNHHAEDLESRVQTLDPGIVLVVVFSVDRIDPIDPTGHGHWVVALEMRHAQEARQDLKAQVSALMTQEAGIRPDNVLLLRPGTVYKTSSGKPRRRVCAQAYALGQWPEASSLWAENEHEGIA
jgi:acyl-CoA synthetase (AMP-forming)/AMP-acid ligase II